MAQAEALEGRGRCMHERSDFAGALLDEEALQPAQSIGAFGPGREGRSRNGGKTCLLLHGFAMPAALDLPAW